MFSPFRITCDSCDFVKDASDSHEAHDYKEEHERDNPGHTCTLNPRQGPKEF